MEGADALTETEQKVFNAIKEVLLTKQFTDACIEYMTQNAAIFEDTDENKLEYTPLFEEYITMTEGCLDGYIKEQMEITQDDIDAFY